MKNPKHIKGTGSIFTRDGSSYLINKRLGVLLRAFRPTAAIAQDAPITAPCSSAVVSGTRS